MNNPNDDMKALLASDLAYDLTTPFLVAGGRKPAIRIPQGERWKPLKGYVPVRGFVDPETGFKALVLENKTTNHRIYAVAGAEATKLRVTDAIASIGVGRNQTKSDEAHEFRKGAEIFALRGGKITVTGQSLGGAVAQPLAYLIQREVKRIEGDRGPFNRRPRVELVTWGAPGTLGLTKEMAKEPSAGFSGKTRFDPAIARSFRTRNYFVAGDIFAGIGTHLGDTYKIPVVPRRPGSKPAEFERRETVYWYLRDTPFAKHFIPGIEDAVRRAGGLGAAKKAPPPKVPLPEEVVEFGGVVSEGLLQQQRIFTKAIRDMGRFLNREQESIFRLDDPERTPTFARNAKPEDLPPEERDRLSAELGFNVRDADTSPARRAAFNAAVDGDLLNSEGVAALPKGARAVAGRMAVLGGREDGARAVQKGLNRLAEQVRPGEAVGIPEDGDLGPRTVDAAKTLARTAGDRRVAEALALSAFEDGLESNLRGDGRGPARLFNATVGALPGGANTVKALQETVNGQVGRLSLPPDPLKVDGEFGPRTEDGVIDTARVTGARRFTQDFARRAGLSRAPDPDEVAAASAFI